MTPTVKAHILRYGELEGWHDEISGRWHYRDLIADERWRRGFIGFDTVTWNPQDRRVYCGLSAIDGDLLYAFDPETKSFECQNTMDWSDKFDARIHRTLLLNPSDGCLYFGTSLLHDADHQRQAPGGKIVCFHPGAKNHEVLGIPFPHLYIQSIAADFNRSLIYAFTYPPEFVVMFGIQNAQTRILAYIGNATMMAQPHNAVVDRMGCLWGTYAETRAWDEKLSQHPIRLFKYDPVADRISWFARGLSHINEVPQLAQDAPVDLACPADDLRLRDDFGFCDSMVYDGGPYIYAGTTAGVLCRIDIENGHVTKVAHVIASGGLPALAIDPSGTIYGAGGAKGQEQLFKWHPDSDRAEFLNDLREEKNADRPARIHDMAIGDNGIIYLAENENHQRSSYLWTVEGF